MKHTISFLKRERNYFFAWMVVAILLLLISGKTIAIAGQYDWLDAAFQLAMAWLLGDAYTNWTACRIMIAQAEVIGDGE